MSPSGEAAAATPTQTGGKPDKKGDTVAGYIEVLEETRVAGWAWCRGRPEAPVEIEIRLDDRVLQRARADRFRQDLLRAGIGSGRHGFNIVFEEPVPPEQKGKLAAFVRCDEGGPLLPLAMPTSKAPGRTTKNSAADHPEEKAGLGSHAILTAIADLRKAMDERLGAGNGDLRSALTRYATDAKAAMQSLEKKSQELRSAQDALLRHVSALEVFQSRLDAALAALRETRGGTLAADTGGRKLTIFVAFLALLSAASIVLGLISVLG